MTLEGDEQRRFRRWLRRRTSLGERSVGDVVSRTRRVMRMLDPLAPEDADELEFRLKQNDEFVECSMSVKSQLKRAAGLYRRFVDQDGREETS